MAAATLVRAVFALLVLATIGAFAVTARLKSSTPVVERVFFQQVISPNDDGRKDSVVVRFDLPERDRVTLQMVDERGDVVRTLAEDVPRGVDLQGVRWSGETARRRWDGTGDGGDVVPDGVYRLRVILREEGRSVTAPRELRVDTRPPRPRLVKLTPPTVVPTLAGSRGRLRIRFDGPRDPAPEFRVWRTDRGEPREVACFRGPRFRSTAVWDGFQTEGCVDQSGGTAERATGRRTDPAPEGTYLVSVTVEDEAGNRGSYPARLPPRPEGESAGSGVSVKYLTLAGPFVPVEAGSVARIAAGPIARRLRWNLSRLGSSRVVANGRAEGREFGIRIPSDARTGVHLLRIQAGGRRAIFPIAVRGREPGRVLVVLPVMTWQGLNPLDDDRDGFPDTLLRSRAVGAERAFAGGRLPSGFETEVSPVLRFLDRERLRYDLTTDLALARAAGPGLEGRPGVLFPGSERWLTERLDRTLRDYVERGGRVASLGTDAFRRRVDLAPGRLVDPSAPEPRNLFGEAVAPVEPEEPASMIVTGDSLDLFAGTDGFVGLFNRFEVSRARPPGAELLASAAPPNAGPAFVAYRLGDGLVMRAGTPGWAAALPSTADVQDVMGRLWRRLGR